MVPKRWIGLGLSAVCASLAHAVDLTGYEYIVVGSGAGGGPLAARLALAGHKTLLIEAGDDHGSSVNYTVPAYHARMTEDDEQAWDFFVRHYDDNEQQARDWKTSYDTPDGGTYTGLNPPPGSRIKGTLYPRSGTLGGCTAHNALVTVYPYMSDFDAIAQLTGDASWSAANMRRHFARLEDKQYIQGLYKGHGRSGWLATELAPLSIPLQDPQLLSLITGGAAAVGNRTGVLTNVATLLAGDANADTRARDTTPGYYQVPLASNRAARTGSREFILAVRDATFRNGTKRYPLDVRLNCHATRILFANSTTAPGQPLATGVAFLDGAHLYRASKKSRRATSPGVPGTATASREVIVAGGAYNSPQLLKLSGIGPAAELRRFDIPLVVDLPGVGANLQDHYEISVNAKVPALWPALKACTFAPEAGPDPCLERWERPVLGDRGTYASNGFAAAMVHKSRATPDGNWDVFAFGGPVNFRGYWPGYSGEAPGGYDSWSWAILRAHPRNAAGRVVLRSADPLDVPEISYRYFHEGTEGWEGDLEAMREGIELARDAIKRQVVPAVEELPGREVQSREEMDRYIRDQAWGHHASCTCPIGADGDPMAVLDSKFRVRGVRGLRVVDASVYPRIPGTFTAVSTYMVGEKAAEDILAEL
ncbi:choline dehydrogenase [Podospora conica]|nr:choline dehydrogenase [Schizothecium conicum]